MTLGCTDDNAIAPGGVFEALHSGLTVELIATPRDDLMTCRLDEAVFDVLTRNTEPYDFLPVVGRTPRGDEGIVGLFHAAALIGHDSADGQVEDYFKPLSEEFLIGADASILAFIRDADQKPCRMVISGPRLTGLVSISDLQKLAVRAALFALITGLEITMAQAIKNRFQGGDGWMACLSDTRQAKIAEEIEKSHRDDRFVDDLLFTQFCDKADILVKSLPLLTSNKALRQRLRDIRKLRDHLAHANEYAATSQDALRVCAVVRSLIALQKEVGSLQPADTATKAHATSE